MENNFLTHLTYTVLVLAEKYSSIWIALVCIGLHFDFLKYLFSKTYKLSPSRLIKWCFHLSNRQSLSTWMHLILKFLSSFFSNESYVQILAAKTISKWRFFCTIVSVIIQILWYRKISSIMEPNNKIMLHSSLYFYLSIQFSLKLCTISII